MRKTTLLSILSLTLLAGCGGTNGSSAADSAQASAALDSNDSTTTESALLVASTDGTESSATAEDAAGTASVRARATFSPSSCVTATAVANVVTYMLNDCTGPWGLVHVTGTVVVTYSKQPDGVHADANATGLLVNGATLNINSQAVYSVNGTAHQLTVTTDGGGTGLRGNTIGRHGSYTLAWDTGTQCAALDGQWSTTIASATWSTSVTGFKVCKNECPSAGTIAHTGGLSHVTVTVTFNGSAEASWTSSRGDHGTVALFCGH
jgi:hypothetical protein